MQTRWAIFCFLYSPIWLYRQGLKVGEDNFRLNFFQLEGSELHQNTKDTKERGNCIIQSRGILFVFFEAVEAENFNTFLQYFT